MFEESLSKAKEEFGLKFALKEKQVEALHALFYGKDTVCLLKTGYGKSVIYQLTPFLLQQKVKNAITLVISPLNAIMKDQVRKLSLQGIPSCFLDMTGPHGESYQLKKIDSANGSDEDESSSDEYNDQDEAMMEVEVSSEELKRGKFRLVFSHPEALISNRHGQELLRSKIYQERVCCIAIDEAHMIHEWGDNFRKDFGRLQDILALFPRVPTLVLTATAPEKVQAALAKSLGLRSPVRIVDNPDRGNIKYIKIERQPSAKQEDELDTILSGLVDGLKADRMNFPMTLIYTDLDAIAYCYRYMEESLGGDQYVGEEIPENRIFAQYHHHYSVAMKNYIVAEICKPRSKVRVVFATVSLGMGLDAPCIRRVIHFKSPTSIEKYLQESGRAGRDGKPSEAILYVNKTDTRANRPGQQKDMTDFCRSKNVCLRQQLLCYLGFDVDPNRTLCLCCNVCALMCNCSNC